MLSKATINNKKNFEIYFVEEDVVNAFALPDGTIVVYSGIVNKMKTTMSWWHFWATRQPTLITGIP
jgi:predicted Zn-dependent protease